MHGEHCSCHHRVTKKRKAFFSFTSDRVNCVRQILCLAPTSDPNMFTNNTISSPRIPLFFSVYRNSGKMGDLFPRDDRQQTTATVAPIAQPHSILKNKGVSFHTVSLTDCELTLLKWVAPFPFLLAFLLSVWQIACLLHACLANKL